MLQWARSTDSFPSALSSQWTRRNGATNPLVSGGMITTNTSAGFYPAEWVARRTAGADQYVAVTLAQLHPGTSGGISCAIFLRCPNNSTSGTVPGAWLTNTGIGIYTMTSWAAAGLTARAAVANANGGANMVIGSRIEFYVIANVYVARYNGAVIATWNDSGAVASQTGRYGGVALQYGNDGSANGVMGFDDFTFGDYRPSEIPTPMQSMKRAASF